MSALKLTDPRYRKWAAAAAGAGAEVLLAGQSLLDAHILTGRPLAVVQAAVGLLVAVGVRQLPNRHPLPGPVD